MDTYNDLPVMTSQTGPHRKDHFPKMSAGKNFPRGTPALDALAEHSLAGFLESEPDIYAVSDIKVRYR